MWIALAVNAAMFLVEMAAGIAGGSKSLQADALDFLGDSANYAISLGVAGMALAWRARAALLKGATLVLLGSIPLASLALTVAAAPVVDRSLTLVLARQRRAVRARRATTAISVPALSASGGLG